MAIREELYDDTGAQMELAGLVSEPTDTDPVSGNEIPVGATAEGVRDDQTASISPGEFVIPDYAVRYHGLDFYVESMQKAKQGLDQMQDMGLVGNPDEQTMPEETPLPSMEEEGMPPQEMPQEAGTEQAMSDTGEPMPTAEFQTGGLATVPIYSPTQQVNTALPVAPPPPVQPIRPISTQPVPITSPAIQQPAAPLLTQYQQGYYIETGGGYYRYQGPPGTSTTQQVYTQDQLPAGAVVAPAGTKYSDVWGTTPGQGFSKQSQYLALQGSAAGQPGGYKVEAYKDAQGNIVYLTTVGGQVQGGVPPGYTKASQEDLGFGAPRQEPRQEATVKPPAPVGDGFDPTGGAGIGGMTSTQVEGVSVGVEASYGASAIGPEVSVAVDSVNSSIDPSFGLGFAGSESQMAFNSMEDVVDSGKHGYTAHSLEPSSIMGKVSQAIVGSLTGPLGKVALSAFSAVQNAPAQPAIAAAQVASTTASGNPYSNVTNSNGFGNFSVASVYGVNTPFGVVTVTSHPTLGVDEVQAIDAVAFGVNPNDPTFDVANFTMDANGVPNGYTGYAGLVGVAEINQAYTELGIGTGTPGTAGEAGGYDLNTGDFVSNTGVVSAMGTMASFNALTDVQQAEVVAARGRGKITSINENKANVKFSEQQLNNAKGYLSATKGATGVAMNQSQQAKSGMNPSALGLARGTATAGTGTVGTTSATSATGAASTPDWGGPTSASEAMGTSAQSAAQAGFFGDFGAASTAGAEGEAADADVAAEAAGLGDTGDGDGGGDGKVICTELTSKGLLDKDVYKLEAEYADKYISEQTMRGYHFWAVPIVKLMRKSSIVTSCIKPFATAWANQVAHVYKPDLYKTGSLLGKVIISVGVPICYALGWFVLTSNYRTLYEKDNVYGN